MTSKAILFLLLLTACQAVRSQDSVHQEVRARIDLIIDSLSNEKDDNKKADLLLSIYTVSIDGYYTLIFETYQKLYNLSQEKKDILVESSAWSLAGQGYRLSGNYVKALECHQKGIALAEQTGNLKTLRYAQNQLGHIYKDRQENEKALTLYRAAAGGDDKPDHAERNWWAYMNMGAVYLNMGQLDSSLFYSTKAREILSSDVNETSIIYLLSNIGSVYSRKGDLLNANNYFAEAIERANHSQSPRFFNSVYFAKAEHFNRLGQFDSCAYYAKKAIGFVQHSMISNLSLQPARLLASLYQNRNADSALKYWQIYMAANDSLYSIRASQQLTMMAFEESQRKKDLETERTNYRNKIKTNLLLAGLAVFCLVALILYRNNKQKQKTNRVLASTLNNLESTQAQLIQSEKMASLGELTAGIAHEIQNPLNFVNNFAEVNRELISELVDEVDKGNTAEVKVLANDIRDNSEKINQHGKRADAIVKGMLQHSQSGKGHKEPTDINALCDEYLRLAYHGLRAKDNSFNAKTETDFDNSIGQINVVPQDIGRVVLNLISNAFYATNEKAKSDYDNYEPVVTVKTAKITAADGRTKIAISVADNGDGIPPKVLDKIFQPFFTTKPTGQGTGLGLSLAYDIVKTHGGEIKVETKEKEGTTFIITLPV